MKDDRLYLRHILNCCSAIGLHASGGREEFLHDRKTQKAVLRELQELAESAQRLSSSLKEEHPAVPWKDISGFRNILVHDYLGLSLPRIWRVIEDDLPLLHQAVEQMLTELEA